MFNRLIFALVGCALAAGCGGHEEPAPSSIRINDFSARYAKAYCDTIGPCCMNAEEPHDRAACIATMQARGERLVWSPPDGREYDPLKGGKCIEATEQSWPMCRTTEAAQSAWADACLAIFAGRVAPGAVCKSDLDCAESSDGPMRCERSALAPLEAPICVLDRPGLAGEPCRRAGTPDPNTPYPHLTCAHGLFCDETLRCKPGSGEGAECRSAPVTCGAGLWCHLTASEKGTCETVLGLGAECFVDVQCSTGLCFKHVCTASVAPDYEACNPG